MDTKSPKLSYSTWFQDYFFEDINRNCIGYINIDSTGMIDCTTYENEASRELSDYAINMVSQVLGEDSLMYYLEKPAISPSSASACPRSQAVAD